MPHQIGALDRVIGGEYVVVTERLPRFILFIKPQATGIVQRQIQVPGFGHRPVEDELVMGLAVIVYFVVVRFAGFLRAGGVVSAGIPIQGQIRGYAIPGLVGDFVPRKYIEAQELVLSRPGRRKVIRVQI